MSFIGNVQHQVFLSVPGAVCMLRQISAEFNSRRDVQWTDSSVGHESQQANSDSEVAVVSFRSHSKHTFT